MDFARAAIMPSTRQYEWLAHRDKNIITTGTVVV